MALTPEQQEQIEMQTALEAIRTQSDNKMRRLEAVRLAKETLIENARSKPVDARDVSASDITSFADTLVSYINQ